MKAKKTSFALAAVALFAANYMPTASARLSTASDLQEEITMVDTSAITPSHRVLLNCQSGGKTTDCTCKANLDPSLYGKTAYNINDFQNNCAHTNNKECLVTNRSCDFYDRTKQTTSPDMVKNKHTVIGTTFPKWIVVPGSPGNLKAVTGVEDVQNRDEQTWNVAWDLRQDVANLLSTPNMLNQKIGVETVGVAINPATQRSKHQLHIHVARVQKSLRKKLQGKFTTFKSVVVGVYKFRAKYVNKNSIDNAFSMAQKELGGTPAHHSIIAVPGEDGQGYYLVLAKDVHVENLLCSDNKDLNTKECNYK